MPFLQRLLRHRVILVGIDAVIITLIRSGGTSK